jgi:hypothetical protein
VATGLGTLAVLKGDVQAIRTMTVDAPRRFFGGA